MVGDDIRLQYSYAGATFFHAKCTGEGQHDALVVTPAAETTVVHYKCFSCNVSMNPAGTVLVLAHIIRVIRVIYTYVLYVLCGASTQSIVHIVAVAVAVAVAVVAVLVTYLVSHLFLLVTLSLSSLLSLTTSLHLPPSPSLSPFLSLPLE